MMPNRTIYVSDADLLVFEEAQRLAGDNLSATIARALRRFVDAQTARATGLDEVTVKVGHVAYTTKRFTGRLLAKGHVAGRSSSRETSYRVFQTARGRFAVHSKSGPNWGAYAPNGRSWAETDWSDYGDYGDWRPEYRLEVYETLDELRPHIPDDLYEAVARGLCVEPVEVLDI